MNTKFIQSETKKAKLKNASLLEVARFVVELHPEVFTITLRSYIYTPGTPSPGTEIFVDRESFLNSKTVEEILNSSDVHTNIALDSKVILSNKTIGHLCLIDLIPHKSHVSFNFILHRVKNFLPPSYTNGVILETNLSYWWFGFNLLSQEEFYKYIGYWLIATDSSLGTDSTSKIYSPLVDIKFIGYSMIQGSTDLRLTTKGNKKFQPRVVALIAQQTNYNI